VYGVVCTYIPIVLAPSVYGVLESNLLRRDFRDGIIQDVVCPSTSRRCLQDSLIPLWGREDKPTHPSSFLPRVRGSKPDVRVCVYLQTPKHSLSRTPLLGSRVVGGKTQTCFWYVLVYTWWSMLLPSSMVKPRLQIIQFKTHRIKSCPSPQQ
jgi:hypothetical protein